MSKIVILGGGFAGVTAAEILTSELGADHEITLVSVNKEFTFFPALVPLVFRDFTADELHFNLRQKAMDRSIRFVQAEVTEIDTELNYVKLAGEDIDGDIYFDHLLVAVGRRLATEKVPGFFEYAHHLLGTGPALMFRKSIENFKGGSIVVGLCPDAFLPVPVCEAALALSKKFEKQIIAGEVKITAVFPETLDKAFVGSTLFRNLEEEFKRKNVEVVYNFPIGRVTEDEVVSETGSNLHFDLVMLVPPFRGQSALKRLSKTRSMADFLSVNRYMQVEGFENIFAAGDIIDVKGPKFGYNAMRQAKAAARNIISKVRKEEVIVGYTHEIEWVISEQYTDPIFFHYGFWDETLEDFDDNAIFGMAGRLREHYGRVKMLAGSANNTASSM
jgi:sulfide:quinone oxidoreductase